MKTVRKNAGKFQEDYINLNFEVSTTNKKNLKND